MTLTLYAIVDAPGPRAARTSLGQGLSRRALSLVPVGDPPHAAVVVESAAPRAASAEDVRAYDAVIRRIAEAHPAVLPIRFGSGAANAPAVGELFDGRDDAIAQALDRVRNCVQYTHRIYVEDAASRAAPLPPAATGDGPGTRWLAERFRAHVVPEAAPLRAAARAIVRAERIERMTQPGDPTLVARVYHLVQKKKQVAFVRAVRAVEPRKGVRVETTGPWPAYAFAELA